MSKKRTNFLAGTLTGIKAIISQPYSAMSTGYSPSSFLNSSWRFSVWFLPLVPAPTSSTPCLPLTFHEHQIACSLGICQVLDFPSSWLLPEISGPLFLIWLYSAYGLGLSPCISDWDPHTAPAMFYMHLHHWPSADIHIK